MNSPIVKAFEEVEKLLPIDKKTIQAFKKRLTKNNTYLQSDGVDDHFCVGVIVMNPSVKKIFIGHHIKSDHWMGAGGHMEEGESPLQTAIRECEEEIGLKVTKATLFDLTHFDDVNRKSCKEHFDFFFNVELSSTPDLMADPGEFHEAGWYTFDEVLKKKLLPKYRASLLKLFKS